MTTDFKKEQLKHWNPKVGVTQRMICRSVVQLSRFVMRTLNRVEFIGTERWAPLFEQSERGILSFTNHVSLFDDPLLISNLGRVAFDKVRWIGADHKNFFGSALKGYVFAAGKCVPIIRGAGLEQPGLAFLTERLRQGEWVHLFPEGGRTRDPEARMRTSFKSGIAQLLAEAKPIAMPFYHYGMHHILPIGQKIPSRGHSVTVRFGEPTVVTDAWLQSMWADTADDTTARYRVLADWSKAELQTLENVTHPGAGGVG